MFPESYFAIIHNIIRRIRNFSRRVLSPIFSNRWKLLKVKRAEKKNPQFNAFAKSFITKTKVIHSIHPPSTSRHERYTNHGTLAFPIYIMPCFLHEYARRPKSFRITFHKVDGHNPNSRVRRRIDSFEPPSILYC